MTLGEKISQARHEAGISQRQLCADTITRNMLSMIEHDAASPSISTLKILAERLKKPMGYFLDDLEPVQMPDLTALLAAQKEYENGRFQSAYGILKEFQDPAPALEAQFREMKYKCLMKTAEEAIRQDKSLLAANSLLAAQACEPDLPWAFLERVLLGAELNPSKAADIPEFDRMLTAQALAAFASGDHVRAGHLLDAHKDHSGQKWNLLRGRVCMAEGRYAEARKYLNEAERLGERSVYSLQEICCREMGDYENAYRYACLQRK